MPTLFRNIALLSGAIAVASKQHPRPDFTPEKAIDGNTNGDEWNLSITHSTEPAQDPFWYVTWPTAHRITKIKVWNRTDCCQERLKDFVLTVYLNGNDVWSSESSTTSTSLIQTSYDFNDIPSGIDGSRGIRKLLTNATTRQVI